jgi:hypothetical protein
MILTMVGEVFGMGANDQTWKEKDGNETTHGAKDWN